MPGGQKLVVDRDLGNYKLKVQDGPWPAFPADLTSIAVALATQCAGSVLIHEWMFENRLVFTDKLVVMGADIIALRPAPRDRHRAEPRCAASALESPDIRAGMAMLIAALCAEGRSEIGNIRQIDRGYERIDERLRDLGARIERVATRAGRPACQPSDGRDDDPSRSPRGRATSCPTRCASCARSPRRCARSSTSHGYGEVCTPALEYEECCARGGAGGAPRLPACSTTTARC